MYIQVLLTEYPIYTELKLGFIYIIYLTISGCVSTLNKILKREFLRGKIAVEKSDNYRFVGLLLIFPRMLNSRKTFPVALVLFLSWSDLETSWSGLTWTSEI